MSVSSTVRYNVIDAVSNAVVFDETIRATYTASFGEAFAGVNRLRLATEGLAWKNIALLIEKLDAWVAPVGSLRFL